MIKVLRKEMGWSIKKLTDAVGIDESRYQYHIKNGRMHASTREAYEQIFSEELKRKIKLPKEP
jgi:transcription initiation factor IIE alpha subunit